MALLTRLKLFCSLEQSLRFNFAVKGQFRSILAPVCQPHARSTVSRRNYFLKLFRKPTQRDLKIKDNVPDGFVLIYRNTMSKYIFGAQIVSIITGSLVLIGFISKTEIKQFNHNRDLLDWSPTSRTTDNEDLYYVTFFIVFLVVIQVVISRTPIRIYKVPQTPKYISVSYGTRLLGKGKYSFKRGEIFRMDDSGILPWRENRYIIKTETDRRTMILLDHYFRRPADLSIMLGEQKDPDLENDS